MHSCKSLLSIEKILKLALQGSFGCTGIEGQVAYTVMDMDMVSSLRVARWLNSLLFKGLL